MEKDLGENKGEKPPVGRNPEPAQSSRPVTASHRRHLPLAWKQLGGQAEATGSTAHFGRTRSTPPLPVEYKDIAAVKNIELLYLLLFLKSLSSPRKPSETLALATMCAAATSLPKPRKDSLELCIGETGIHAEGIRLNHLQSPDIFHSLSPLFVGKLNNTLVSDHHQPRRAAIRLQVGLAHLWNPFQHQIVARSLFPNFGQSSPSRYSSPERAPATVS
jgi:hypothetical protein